MSAKILGIFAVVLLLIGEETIKADDSCSEDLICGVCIGGGADCLATKDGEGYSGKVSKTKGNLECQNWSKQSPHSHGLSRLGDNNFCRNPDGEPTVWCYTSSEDKRWDTCTVPLCTDQDKAEEFKQMKKVYQNCIANPKCGDCKEIIKTYLPVLCEEDLMKEGDIGIDDGQAYLQPSSWFPDVKYFMTTLPLLTGDDRITVRTNEKNMNNEVKINGTVSGNIGKRWYGSGYRKHRPTGLYAAQGDIVSITIPEKLVGKIKVNIGHSFELPTMWIIPKKSVCNIGSPWGGLIQIYLTDTKATEGIFSITVDNAIKAPEFIYGQTKNKDWKNEIRKYSPKWAVLRVPGQLDVYVQTLKINHITDMDKVVSSWKKTMDLLEDMIGLPPNTLPGAEEMRFQTGMTAGLRGYHSGVCSSGTAAIHDFNYLESSGFQRSNIKWKSTGKYYDNWFHGNGTNHVVLHELGHGFCHSHLPSHGEQWFADYTEDYINFKLGFKPEHSAKKDMNFDLLYRLVAFGLHSEGSACGEAKFTKEQLKTGSYDTCWKFLNTIPAIEFGYDILSQVNKLVVQSDQSYDSKAERHVDLYCKASKHNLMPLFNFYNIKVKNSISESCEKQPDTTLITQWLKVVNCVKESMELKFNELLKTMESGVSKDVQECSKLPLYPEHKGVCTFTGVCKKDKAYGMEVNMKNTFDLYDKSVSRSKENVWKELKSGSSSKQKCLERALAKFEECGNDESRPITAKFSTSSGVFNYTVPGSECLLSKDGKDYSGKVSKTKGNLECQNWSKSHINGYAYSKLGDNNFCRNPDGEPWTVWCYTDSEYKKWDTCDVPLC